MKLGLILGYSGAELRIPLEDVKLAEQLGYDSVWTAEAYGSDAITPLAHIAAHTDRIRLGTAVLQLAGRTLGERWANARQRSNGHGDSRSIVWRQ